MREDIRQTKLQKLENLRKAGLDPYPEKTDKEMFNQEALDKFDEIGEEKKIILAGRIRSLRPMGGSTFAHIEDGSGKIQVFLNKKNIGDDEYKLFIKNIELGDFIEIKGKLFKTKTGEKSISALSWKILSKNLRPIPTEHFGMKDEEERLRRRYLDLLVNPETRELFKKKSLFWKTVRDFFSEKDFMEVQTPILEETTGGAEAEPFVTHHNALDRDFYLRISLELPLKRLLVGGYDRVYEIGRVFRNEGIDREHLQEFDHMEFYWSYADMEQGMQMVEEMFKKIIENITGGLKTVNQGEEIDWSGSWPHIDYFEAFKKETGLDLSEEPSLEELKKKADELGIKYEVSYGRGRMIDTIYKKMVRQKLIQPCMLVGHPIEVSPLAKKDPNNPKRTLRYQPIAGKSELGNGFAELNDPIDQKKRFEEQLALREAGDQEAQMLDEDFIEALEVGMPPASGFGMSERLFSFIMDRPIREIVFFPPMKERGGEAGSSEEELELGLDYIQAKKLLEENVKDEINKLHAIESEVIMRDLAKKFGEDEEKWGIIGLLHDIDWDLTKDSPSDHGMKSREILKNAGATDQLMDIIESHVWGIIENKAFKDKKRSKKIEHALACAETVTGLIVAATLVHPDKKLKNLEVKSLKKRFKDKRFAANCNREMIKECEDIGLTLDEFLDLSLKSLQQISDKLGL